MEITGRIIKCLPRRSGTSQRTGNAWASQDFVLEYFDNPQSQYPRHLAFGVFGEDRLNQFNIQEGQDVTVSFDLDAREYQGRWYTDVRAWRVVPAGAAGAAPAAPQFTAAAPSMPAPAAPAPTQAPAPAQDDSGELPF